MNVTSSAPTASGLETACQKPCAPAFFASQSSAAMGRRTTTSRTVETAPSERPVVTLPPAPVLRVL
jgi:hypothetical protein